MRLGEGALTQRAHRERCIAINSKLNAVLPPPVHYALGDPI